MSKRVQFQSRTNSDYIYGVVQERHNSSALAVELRLSCTNPSIYAAKSYKGDVPCIWRY